MRQPVQEVRRPVERVDNPAVAVVLAFADAAFLHQEAEVGPCLAQVLADDALRFGIGRRYEIRGSLAADLKMSDTAEVADKGSARHPGGPGHDCADFGRQACSERGDKYVWCKGVSVCH